MSRRDYRLVVNKVPNDFLLRRSYPSKGILPGGFKGE